MTTQTTPKPAQTRDRAGKYLTFMLGSESYGLDIHKVRAIVAMLEITPVPRTLPFIRGVINLRGHVIPVMDLRRRLGLPEVETHHRTCVIVVEIRGTEVGMIVDRVSDVIDINGEDIDNAVAFGMQVDTDFVLGIGKSGDRVTILLDVDMAISSEETDSLVTTG